MELRILKLNVNIRYDGAVGFMVQNPDKSSCKLEELCNDYDVIQITYARCKYDTYSVKKILEKLNYCYYYRNDHYYGGPYGGIGYDECYINNEFKKNIIFTRDKDGYVSADGQHYIISDFMYYCIRDSLPCFVRCKYSNLFLLSKYKITKTNVHELYYVEQLGKLTKAAIKKLE